TRIENWKAHAQILLFDIRPISIILTKLVLKAYIYMPFNLRDMKHEPNVVSISPNTLKGEKFRAKAIQKDTTINLVLNANLDGEKALAH
ncbi:hypothetical protein ACJX0J_031500, partial [Zea mays]